LLVTGFTGITWCWGRAAGLAEPSKQLPFVGTSLFFLALVGAALGLLSTAASGKDAELRARAIERLAEAVADVRPAPSSSHAVLGSSPPGEQLNEPQEDWMTAAVRAKLPGVS